jgi:adenylate cyclase class IV
MFEIEKKFEIPELFLLKFEKNLETLNYHFHKLVKLTDYYVSFESSKIKPNSFDFLKFRFTKGKTVVRTQKTWAIVNGLFQRKEDEDEFDGIIPEAKYILKKERKIFENTDNSLPEVTIDILNINGNTRYFIEAELVTDQQEKIAESTDSVLNILGQLLEKDLTNEKQAPTMLQLLMEMD